MDTATVVCLAVAVGAAVIAAAFGGAVVVLARRVDGLAADLTELARMRAACPDQGRITALETYASGGQGAARRHARPPQPPPAAPRPPAPPLRPRRHGTGTQPLDDRTRLLQAPGTNGQWP